MTERRTSRPRVVILGGGFGGLYAARQFRKAEVEVTVVDRRNHHLFQPLLYQVATAALNPSDIAAPIRGVLRRSHVKVLLAEATGIDVPGERVLLKDGELPFDFLIVSTGVTHSYFGHPEWARWAMGLKTIEDALEIRRRVLWAYEMAEREIDEVKREQLLTFCIIGAGPTGVELAGALAEVARHALAHDFRNIDPRKSRIVLIEGVAHVLPTYPEVLSEKAKKSLEKLGIEVRTGARVTQLDGTGVWLGDEKISARTTLWAAGVEASPLAKSLGAPMDRAGRVKVTPQLTLPGNDGIFVIGDLALVEQDGKPVPGVAPAAIQEGKHAATNILRSLKGEPYQPFRYWDRGTFAVIGRGSAVGVAFSRLKMSGFSAWFAWLAIHLFFLIGFRNRLVVLMNWAYSYLTLRRSARLITGDPARSLLPPP
jgi:NADH:ubiquinone reductase (H+-translocating)